MPPCAATYWSCLPTGSPSTSISISHAASASAPGVIDDAPRKRERLQQADGERAGRAHPGPGGDVGDRRDLERVCRCQWRSSVSRRIGWRISDGLVDLLELRVLQPVAALEDRVREHVDVLVDRARRRGSRRARGSTRAGRCPPPPSEIRSGARREDDAHRGGSPTRRPTGSASSQSSVRWTASRDRQRRRPAERADARAVEVDQRAVADPAAGAARVLELGRDAEVRADRRRSSRRRRRSRRCRGCRRRRARASVVGVDERSGSPRRSRRRRGTTSRWRPSPSTRSRVGIVAQRAVEVEDVPVGVALAEDRDEAEDHAGEPVARAQ